MYEKFIELCKQRNKSQTEVLKELNISPSNAANWKNRGGSVRSDVLIKIADYFDVSVDWLLGRDTKKENTIDDGVTLDVLKNDHLFYMNTMKLFNLPLEYRHAIYDQIDYQSFRYLNDTKKKDASSVG